MRSPFLTVIVMSILLVQALGSRGANRGIPDEAECKKAIELTRLLESEPLSKEAARARKQMARWLVLYPDIEVRQCSVLLGSIADERKKEFEFISMQLLYSGAAYIIEHPEEGDDRLAVYAAGLEGALRAYEAILRDKPRLRRPYLDRLIRLRDDGTLIEYVTEVMERCP